MKPPRQLLDEAVTESDLQAAVIELAQLRGCLRHHDRPGATAGGRWATQIQGDPGFPDLVLVRGAMDGGPGGPCEARVLFVELKREHGKLTDAQERWQRDLSDLTARAPSAVEVHIWRPSDWSSGEIERRLA